MEEYRFQTKEAALEFCRKHAFENQYSLRIKKNEASGLVAYVCSFQGSATTTSNEKRIKALSRRCNCKFRVSVKQKLDKENLSGFWLVTLRGEHNHPASAPVSLPFHRKLTSDAKSMIDAMSLAVPSVIRDAMRSTHSQQLVIAKDIYNRRYKNGVCERQDRDDLNHGLHMLAESPEFSLKVFSDYESCELKSAFFYHSFGRSMLEKHNRVLFCDTTYKVVVNGYPLINIVGMSASGKSFYVAHAFIMNEKQPMFEWVFEQLRDIMSQGQPIFIVDRDRAQLSALQTIFPLCEVRVCTWHFDKCVEHKLLALEKAGVLRGEMNDSSSTTSVEPIVDRQALESEWRAIRYYDGAPLDFDELYSRLKHRYPQDSIQNGFFAYIDKQWMPFRQYWASCFFRNKMSLGYSASSVVESSHARIKRRLAGSRPGMTAFVKHLSNIYEDIRMDFTRTVDRERQGRMAFMRTSHMFESINGKVSHLCMLLLQNEVMKISQSEHGECVCRIRSKMGLPCWHEIQANGSPIALELIDTHWLLQSAGTVEAAQNLGYSGSRTYRYHPEARQKGRPFIRKRRISHFEKPIFRCGKCREVGHTIITCKN